MIKNKDIVKIIRDNSEKISPYGVKKIGVFGSFVKSMQRNDSDIDILVEFKEGAKTFDNYMDLKFFLNKILHRKIDLVIKDALKSRIRREIIRETVYARL